MKELEIPMSNGQSALVGTLPPPDPDETIESQTLRLTAGFWKKLTAMAKDESTEERRFTRHGLIKFVLEQAVKKWEEAKASATAVEPQKRTVGVESHAGNGHRASKKASKT